MVQLAQHELAVEPRVPLDRGPSEIELLRDDAHDQGAWMSSSPTQHAGLGGGYWLARNVRRLVRSPMVPPTDAAPVTSTGRAQPQGDRGHLKP
jgi:hypothetical protein